MPSQKTFSSRRFLSRHQQYISFFYVWSVEEQFSFLFYPIKQSCVEPYTHEECFLQRCILDFVYSEHLYLRTWQQPNSWQNILLLISHTGIKRVCISYECVFSLKVYPDENIMRTNISATFTFRRYIKSQIEILGRRENFVFWWERKKEKKKEKKRRKERTNERKKEVSKDREFQERLSFIKQKEGLVRASTRKKSISEWIR